MKKKDAFAYMETKLGYVPTKLLFNDLYINDNDEIPMDLINYSLKMERMSREFGKTQRIVVSAEVANRFNEIF